MCVFTGMNTIMYICVQFVYISKYGDRIFRILCFCINKHSYHNQDTSSKTLYCCSIISFVVGTVACVDSAAPECAPSRVATVPSECRWPIPRGHWHRYRYPRPHQRMLAVDGSVCELVLVGVYVGGQGDEFVGVMVPECVPACEMAAHNTAVGAYVFVQQPPTTTCYWWYC
jgi:hypothetical protein